MRLGAFRWLAVGPILAVASPACAQMLGGAQAPDISIWRVLFALIVCILLAVAGGFALRFRVTGRLDLPRLTPARPRRLVLVERLRLNVQHELCIIAYDGREQLVSVSPAGIARFDLRGDAAPPAAP